MTFTLAAPAIVAVLALAIARAAERVTRPSTAVWALTTAMVMTTLATATVMVQIAGAGLSEIPAVADLLGWCRAVYGGQHGATPLVGTLAAGALAILTWRTVRHIRNVRSTLRQFDDVNGVQVVELDRPVVFAVPGNPGGVVISSGLLDELDANERAVVLAHENAHLRFHHHVFVRVARACASFLPLLHPMALRVAFLTERWADEFAAERVGSRRLVADTIARVALLPGLVTPSQAHGLASHGVIARFEALESGPPVASRRAVAIATAASAITLVAAALQLHHLADFLLHTH